MKKLLSLMLAAVFAVCCAVPSLARTDTTTPTRGDAIGMDLSEFVTQDLYGNPVDGSIFSENTLTVVNMWATWCGPCLSEMPHFETLHQNYSATPENDVMMLGVLIINGSSTVASGKQVIESNGYTYLNIVENALFRNVLLTTADSSGSVGIPQSVIVDRNGIVRDHIVGSFPNYAQVNNWVTRWLEELSGEEPTPPPETEPPVTEPPVTEPPVTEPPVTEPPVTEPPVTEPPAVPGDFDGDGQVTSSDAVNILRVAMGLGEVENIEVIDLDGDGAVATADAILALRLAMGL